jgi:hypothetical protein
MDVGIPSAPVRLGYDGLLVQADASVLSGWDRSRDAVHHVAATYDDGLIALYFDGRCVGRGGDSGKGPMTMRLGDIRFGEDYPPTSLTNEPFIGRADDILILRRVLTPEEITAIAKNGVRGVLTPDAESGVLYTMEGDAERGVVDRLVRDGAQNATIPGPPLPGEVELVLNYATSAAGSIRCEILDAAAKPIAGVALADCDLIYGDDIERTVTWHGVAELKQLAGKPVRVRFVMKDADLYAMRFRN